jgi:hypothetical protein
MSDLPALARRALQLADEKDLSLITAESCTAGKLSALLSEAPGAMHSRLRPLGFIDRCGASPSCFHWLPGLHRIEGRQRMLLGSQRPRDAVGLR